MIPCKRASQYADVLVAICRYEDWQLVSFKSVSQNNAQSHCMMQWLPLCQHLVYNELKYIFVANLMDVSVALAPDCSNSIAKALELLQSCTKPSICFTCKVSLFIPLVIFLGLLHPNHIQNMYQTYYGNSLVFEKKMVEIMRTGFGKCKHLNFKQKTIWIRILGFHQWSSPWFRQWLWTNKETSH